MDANETFGPTVYSYSRAQAIEDGFLVDVSATAREAWIKLPTVVTRHVWNECVEVPEKLKGQQDEAGRLRDVVNMAALALRAAVAVDHLTDRTAFSVRVRKAGGHRREQLVAVVGPGDTAQPVLTLMYPEDD